MCAEILLAYLDKIGIDVVRVILRRSESELYSAVVNWNERAIKNDVHIYNIQDYRRTFSHEEYIYFFKCSASTYKNKQYIHSFTTFIV